MSDGLGASEVLKQVVQREAELGIELPRQLIQYWRGASERHSRAEAIDPLRVLAFEHVDEMTPLVYLPFERFSGFSTAGVLLTQESPRKFLAVAAQDYESMNLDIATADLNHFLDNPSKLIPNSIDRLVKPDATAKAIERVIMPGYADEWDEMQLFRPFWLDTEEFADNALKVFENFVSSYGSAEGVAKAVRSAFPDAEAFSELSAWAGLVQQLIATKQDRLALRLLENWRALLLVGMRDFDDTWPEYHEDSEPYWKVVEQQLKLARDRGWQYEIQFLRKVLESREDE